MSTQTEAEREAEMKQTLADPELRAAYMEDERLCAAGDRVRLALDVIRLSYQATNEEINRYGLLVVRDEAWRVVAEGLTQMRGYPVKVIAVAPRWRGRRCIPRFKVVKA